MLATLPEPDLGIVDALQDAALDPSLWRDALERVAHRIGCIGGGILTQDPILKTGSALAGFGIDLAHTEQYFRHYTHVNPMLHRAIMPPLGQPLTAAALMPRHAFAMTEFCNDWIRPQGFSDAVGVVVHRDGTQFTWLSAMRPHCVDDWQRADLDALARLAPHVTRALRVAHRLGVLEEHQRALQEALDQVAHATMLIDRRGRLVFANAVAEALLGAQQTLTVAHGRLLACHPAADAALQAALARSLSHRRDEQHGIEDVPLPRAERRPLVLSVMPARGHAAERLDPDLRVAAIVIAVDPEARPWPRLGGFMNAYGLTPAEGKVLDAVVDGDGVDAIADRLGIRRTTVKTHLNRILGKTGTTRQHELIRLVAGSVPPLRS